MPVSIALKGARLLIPELKCACGGAHHSPSQDLLVGSGLVRKLPLYIKRRELGEKAVMITDQAGWEAAGRSVLAALRDKGFEVTLTVLSKARADERALGEALLAMRMDTEFFVGVGADAVASVTRSAATQTERPYALLATQPTGCGYLSREAHMLLRGEPMTLPAVAPEIVAFDTDILRAAPAEAYAQGLADLAACHLARADWAALALLRGDGYCPLCANLAVAAAERAFAAIPDIAERSDAGLRKMAQSLLTAGVAAFVSGGARPVSSLAQTVARRAVSRIDEPYGALLPGAVVRLLDAYRAADPGAGPGEFAAHAAPIRQLLDKLPAGSEILSAIRAAAPGAIVARPPLEWPRAQDMAECGSLMDMLAPPDALDAAAPDAPAAPDTPR
jgi:glycerol dehydrogenase-like iron-containing ADH family enzyme